MRVLVAEDDQGLRDVLARGLREKGYVVDLVADGSAAIGFLRSYDHAVVVLDWRMPKVSGLEVLQWIRRRESPAAVLMLTARDPEASGAGAERRRPAAAGGQHAIWQARADDPPGTGHVPAGHCARWRRAAGRGAEPGRAGSHRGGAQRRRANPDRRSC